MKEQAESLSALVDGEVDELELRRLLSHSSENDILAQKWRRYHLASAIMHKKGVALPKTDLSAAVMDSIARDEALSAKPAARSSVADRPSDIHSANYSMWKSVASMAVAASVTAAIILGVGMFDQNVDTGTTGVVSNVTLPQSAGSSSYVRTRLGSAPDLTTSLQQLEIIRSPASINRYIDQHQHLTADKKVAQWQPGWLPEGYSHVRHELIPFGEVMVFSNGQDAFSISIEQLGREGVPEGVSQAGGYVALGKAQSDYFVTVVGNLPLMLADRVASSVQLLD
ncbi:MucB/RseB C-terminal domain-containing protein [Nitrincola sp. MINF-07-Sa-05]|uniref:MucB/RseB C-terminal domain-containing protein n=1 Tax=Nitrincola salilacus TaxID=3400273 RepID=UPI00391845A5